jgi:hypothetical protein
MSCRQTRNLLFAYLDGALTRPEQSQVEAHLLVCPACRRLSDASRTLEEKVRAVRDTDDAPRRPIRQQATEQWLAEREVPVAHRRTWLAGRRLAPGARWATLGAVSMVILAAFLSGWQPRRPAQPVHEGRTAGAMTSRQAAPSPAKASLLRTGPGERIVRRDPAVPGRGDWIAAPVPSRVRPEGEQRDPPSPRGTRTSPTPVPDDLAYVNTAANAPMRRPEPPARDDFVQIPFPLLVSNSDAQVGEAVASHRREEAVVDDRLHRTVAVRQKAVALSDLCAQLRAETGIELSAGASVADEKVTLFCRRTPLREVMRQLSRPFGYTWIRSGRQPEYRYELAQDLRSQLLEEELRNRERNAALLALDGEVQRYRKYLELSPDEALAQARTAAPEEKRLLEKLAKEGWGPIHMYFRLSPSEFEALKSGQELKYGHSPDFGGSPLPADVERGVLQSLRDIRVVRREDDRLAMVEPGDPSGMRLTALPEARGIVQLKLTQSELGQYTLGGGSGFRALRTISVRGGDPYAIGRSPSSAHPNNQQTNAALAGTPALRRSVSVRPQPSCEAAHRPLPDLHPSSVGQRTSSLRDLAQNTGRAIPGASPPQKLRVTYADALEELHSATGLPIVADAYTRLYEQEVLSIRDKPLFQALNQLADTARLRWTLSDGKWLQFRSASYFNDRLQEVPNRLLTRWSASRRQHGALTLADLVEIAQLSDAQLDAREVAEGAQECFGLQEWPLAKRWTRPHLRYLASFTPAQQQAAMSSGGLAFRQMTLAQQQQFIRFAFYEYAKRPPSGGLSDQDAAALLQNGVLRVAYRQPGAFEWKPMFGPKVRQEQGAAELSFVSAPTREEALQRARRIDPEVDPESIVPTEPSVIFQYAHGRTLNVRANLTGSTVY